MGTGAVRTAAVFATSGQFTGMSGPTAYPAGQNETAVGFSYKGDNDTVQVVAYNDSTSGVGYPGCTVGCSLSSLQYGTGYGVGNGTAPPTYYKVGPLPAASGATPIDGIGSDPAVSVSPDGRWIYVTSMGAWVDVPSAYCVSSGAACTVSSTCPGAGESCILGVCTSNKALCTMTSTCPAGQSCVLGLCSQSRAACTVTSSTCPTTETCVAPGRPLYWCATALDRNNILTTNPTQSLGCYLAGTTSPAAYVDGTSVIARNDLAIAAMGVGNALQVWMTCLDGGNPTSSTCSPTLPFKKGTGAWAPTFSHPILGHARLTLDASTGIVYLLSGFTDGQLRFNWAFWNGWQTEVTVGPYDNLPSTMKSTGQPVRTAEQYSAAVGLNSAGDTVLRIAWAQTGTDGYVHVNVADCKGLPPVCTTIPQWSSSVNNATGDEIHPQISYGDGRWVVGYLTSYQDTGGLSTPGTFSVGYQTLFESNWPGVSYWQQGAPKIVPGTGLKTTTQNGTTILCQPGGDYDSMAYNKSATNFVYTYSKGNPGTPQCNPTVGYHIFDAAIPYPSAAFDGFEQPVMNPANSFMYAPAASLPGQPWSFSSLSGHDGAGISGNGSGFTLQNANAPQGAQVGFIQGHGSAVASFNFPNRGTYTVSAQVAQRKNYQQSSQTVSVIMDQIIVQGIIYYYVKVGEFTAASDGYYHFTKTGPFEVLAGFHNVGLNGNASDDSTLFLDALEIQGPV